MSRGAGALEGGEDGAAHGVARALRAMAARRLRTSLSEVLSPLLRRLAAGTWAASARIADRSAGEGRCRLRSRPARQRDRRLRERWPRNAGVSARCPSRRTTPSFGRAAMSRAARGVVHPDHRRGGLSARGRVRGTTRRRRPGGRARSRRWVVGHGAARVSRRKGECLVWP